MLLEAGSILGRGKKGNKLASLESERSQLTTDGSLRTKQLKTAMPDFHPCGQHC
jgi:hypothetical protein